MTLRTAAGRWEHIAKVEPYYAVLSQPQFLSERIAESRAAFFESGERDVAALIHALRGVDRTASVNRVLEFGCGPGRLIPALLRRGFHVTAVDQSGTMLERARESAREAGPGVATFARPESLTEESAAFDLAILSRVLQHMSVAAAAAAFEIVTRRIADDGFLYLNAPIHSTQRLLSRTMLLLRQHVGPLNRVANRLRRRSSSAPVLVPVVHDLDALLLTLHRAHFEIVSFRLEAERELTTAHVLARKRSQVTTSAGALDPAALESHERQVAVDDPISPAELVTSVGIEELNARAERYFARSEDWTPQLAKPFSNPTEAPPMLVSLGVVLQGAALAPGMTVLDFGGGTGWLSRFLLQFGCRVILCDVAPTALRIASDFIQRHPPVGGDPADFRVSLFDGYRIDLGDAEVDRIICFDSFHHVPNIEAALAEFARVLKPGGLAAFSEPGPHHSQSAQSQFEMRVHGVLENDVDVRRIWDIARGAGFDDLRLIPFNGAPESMTLDAFENLLREGPALKAAARSLRDFTANVRTFILRKHGVEKTDSRVARGLSCAIRVALDAPVRAGAATPFTAHLTNTGTGDWLPSSSIPGGVSLGGHLYRDGLLANFDLLWTPIGTAPVLPNAEVLVRGEIPPLEPGRYIVEFDCVAHSVVWFTQIGSPTARLELDVKVSA